MKKTILTIMMLILIASLSISQPIDKSIKWFDVGSNQFKVQPIPFIPMDSTIAANVTTPVAGKGNIFIGLDRKMYAKWVGGTVTEIGGGTAGANTALSNLTSPIAVNQEFTPNNDITHNLGNHLKKWKGLHIGGREEEGEGIKLYNGVGAVGSIYHSFSNPLTADRGYYLPNRSGTFAVAASSPLALSLDGLLSMPAATTSVSGHLTSTDWNTFNNKITNPMTTAGDVIYGATAGVPTRRAIGSTGQVLTVSGGLPVWADAAGGANTALSNLTSPTAINQDLIYTSGKMAIFDAYNSTGVYMAIYNSGADGRLTFVHDLNDPVEKMTIMGDGVHTVNLIPTINGAYDIGTTSLRYRDAWFLGNVTGTWNGSTISVGKGGTGQTTLTSNALLVGNGTGAINTISAGAANTFLQSNGTAWDARQIYYTAAISAASDEVDVSITGLTATSVVFASWGKSVTGVPLGQLYVVSTGTNTCKIRSNTDELNNHNIVVTVVQW